MSDISHHIGNIGFLLSQLGNELQKQARTHQPMNIHSQVKQTMDNLTYYLYNLNMNNIRIIIQQYLLFYLKPRLWPIYQPIIAVLST